MGRVLITFVVVFCFVGCVDPPADDQVLGRDLPKFMLEKEITCAMFADAINHYVKMGEEKAIAALKALADSKPKGDMADHAQTRMAFTCRALFEPKGKAPLHAPAFGGLNDLPSNTMPLEHWPLYPVVHVGSSYFVLSEGYSSGGVPEQSISYINYCCAEGRFRKDRVPLPTKAQALRDFELLRESGPWKALKWKDRGQGFYYELDENGVLEYLKAQAERIPAE